MNEIEPTAPIGVFDSGFGGLTVARAIADVLPNEDIVYVGDTARAPYGPRPIAEVRRFALECLDKLVNHGVKALVIACNTASAVVLRDARERYDVPIVEVVLPAARRAAAVTRNGRIGVICTKATAISMAYEDALAANPGVAVTTSPCPRFVEFVEAGITSGPEVLAVARDYLAPIKRAGCDTLILGCTHYPLLEGVVSYVMGDAVNLVSSSSEAAQETWRVLNDLRLATPNRDGSHRLFLTTGDAERFQGISRRLLPAFVNTAHEIHVGSLPTR
ncbi:glutamate racemase [Aestuariimicrobium sp. p3-SID1156]|uniref:glutamate racemase n=1 Tax=Aestuariimicrobium sp. p3-SID1156 TaxID=2916038 RepID=UPI00223AF4F6|nr:glutamate racemase [Aestuariimicrobium sp. p3-SID1156]MCT1459980.1 glutamate racemase [Aestuariimicrobium sp. p3-SID1156]